MKRVKYAICATLLLATTYVRPAAAEDTRELVKFPPMMAANTLTEMRDHLLALNEIMGELAVGNADKAADIAENRLGMSAMDDHNAAMKAKYMPEGMQDAGVLMHHAASRFAIAVQDAALAPSDEAQQKVYGALEDITNGCIACHEGYRLH